MKHKSFDLEFKAFDESKGIVEGYATTFGFPADLDGDIINEKAFDLSLQKINEKGIPLLDGHGRDSVNKVVGTVFSAIKTSKGIYIKAKLADTPANHEIYMKLQQGHINKFSIGFMIEDAKFVTKDNQEYREITQAEMYEVSIVAIPANPRADILAVKEASLESEGNSEFEGAVAVEETNEQLSESGNSSQNLEAEANGEVEATIQAESVEASGTKLESEENLDALKLQFDLLSEQVEITRRKLENGN